MSRILTSIDISAPPAHVFAFFIPQRMTSWYAAEISATIEVLGGADEFAAGQKIRISGRAPSLRRRAAPASDDSAARELSLTAVITAYEWGRLLEWRFRDPYGVSGLQRWELSYLSALEGRGFNPADPQPQKQSGALAREGNTITATTHTRLIFLDSYEMPTRLTRLFDLLLTRHAVRRRNLAALSRLKKLIEH